MKLKTFVYPYGIQAAAFSSFNNGWLAGAARADMGRQGRIGRRQAGGQASTGGRMGVYPRATHPLP